MYRLKGVVYQTKKTGCNFFQNNVTQDETKEEGNTSINQDESATSIPVVREIKAPGHSLRETKISIKETSSQETKTKEESKTTKSKAKKTKKTRKKKGDK